MKSRFSALGVAVARGPTGEIVISLAEVGFPPTRGVHLAISSVVEWLRAEYPSRRRSDQFTG